MNYTSNMGMNMPDENDKFSIEHFNTNTQALDIVGKPDEYKNTKTYAVGDLCIHNNILYKCITAVETAEEFNAEKWEVTSLCKEEIANKTVIAELTEKINGISGEVKYGYISIPKISYTAYELKDITASFDVEFEKAPSMVFLFTNSKTAAMPLCCFNITASTLGIRMFYAKSDQTTGAANTYIRYIAIFD